MAQGWPWGPVWYCRAICRAPGHPASTLSENLNCVSGDGGRGECEEERGGSTGRMGAGE